MTQTIHSIEILNYRLSFTHRPTMALGPLLRLIGSLGVHGLPLNSIGNARYALGAALPEIGLPLGHFGQSCGALWATWGCIGASWERLGIALGMPWDYSGPHWKKSVRWETHRKPMDRKYRACAQK